MIAERFHGLVGTKIVNKPFAVCTVFSDTTEECETQVTTTPQTK